jgi:hypothetical protein
MGSHRSAPSHISMPNARMRADFRSLAVAAFAPAKCCGACSLLFLSLRLLQNRIIIPVLDMHELV